MHDDDKTIPMTIYFRTSQVNEMREQAQATDQSMSRFVRLAVSEKLQRTPPQSEGQR